MTSELESLKQENARLMARIAELEHVVGESTRREAENVELKAEVTKLRHDFEELKQQTQVITNVQDTPSIGNIPEQKVSRSEDVTASDITISKANPTNTSASDICQKSNTSICTETKSLEDKKIDAFLESEHKRSVSNEIRKRNREKKIQHTISSGINSTTEISQDTISTINDDRKIIQSESEWAKPRVEDSSQTFSSEITKLNKIPYNQKVEQYLRHELSVCVKNDSSEINSGASAKAHNVFDIQIPELSLETIIRGSGKITTQNIVDVFNVSTKTRQKEILCWYCYYKANEDRIEDIKRINNIDDQKARTLVYNEIKLLLPDITDINLRQRTFKAKKIYTLFMGIGIDRIRQVTCSASAISSLKDDQIQNIINCFPKKSTNMDDTVKK
ncbi:4928_t:CDS:1 [Entrophospora sp. SA101]|nr:4928_t:CDS:1 [Entrophospora sp. SA101]